MFSRSSQYAIRTLTYLAIYGKGEFHLARDLAAKLGMPGPFLGKVLQPLVARGLLDSRRGRSGGFKLALAPEDITLRQIVETQESTDTCSMCMLGQERCTLEDDCPMHTYWAATSRSYIALLDNTSLADLTGFCAGDRSCSYPLPNQVTEERQPALPPLPHTIRAT